MKDEDEQKEEQEVASTLEKEGIVIESEHAKDELEEELGNLNTKEGEKELFDALGVEMPAPAEKKDEPKADDLKKELDLGGIKILPPEPLAKGEE